MTKLYKFLVLGGVFLWGLLFNTDSLAETASSTKYRVVLLGVDGLTERVVSQLIKENKLKNIKYLMDNGASGKIVSLPATISPALWTTMATGKLPKKHGITDFQIANNQGRMVVVNSSYRKTKALWNVLSEQNFKIGSIGYFATWPAEEIDGFMISDTSISPIEKGFSPPTLYPTIKKVLSPYLNRDIIPSPSIDQFDYEDEQCFTYFTPRMFRYLDQMGGELINDYLKLKIKDIYSPVEAKQYQEFLRRHDLIRRILWFYFFDRIKFEYTQRLYRNEIDFFTLYLRGVDTASHIAWEYYEPNPDTPPANIAAYKDILPNYCVFVDNVVGYFLEHMANNTIFILVSDHGFNKKPNLLFNINKMLHTLGYLDYDADNIIKKDKIFNDNLYRWVMHVPFRRLHVNLNNLYPGRNPDEDESKVKQIVAQLAAIKVGDLPLFEKVNYYSGIHAALAKTKQSILQKRAGTSSGLYSIEAFINWAFYAPEFLQRFNWDEHISINQRLYPVKKYLELVNTGDHTTNEGVVFFLGPIIKPNHHIDKFCVTDVTPTILKIMNLPVGRDMDGTVSTDLFKPEFIQQNPISYIKSYDEINEPLKKTIPMETPQEDKIKEQLRSLGYIQ